MELRTAVSITLSDDDRRRLLSLGYIGGGGGSPDAAMSLTRDIKDMAPVIAKGHRASDAARSGYRQMAIRLMIEVSKECPECTSYSSELATMFIAEKDYDKAVVVLRNLVNRIRRRADGEGLPLLSREENTYGIALFNLGLALGQLERFEEAIPYVEEAVERNPDLGYMQFTLAELYDKIGQSKKALEICERASLERPPPECVLLFAELHKKVGSPNRAKQLAFAVLQSKNIKPAQRKQARAILGLDEVTP
jgi:tetratricopeptide (TPR) repeat protein